MSRILILEENKRGRDYVTGDIHGMFGALKSALRFHRFNFAKDRLICTGDLVDRGDKSLEVIEYLSAPWFYSVLGNHDTKLLARHGHTVGDVSTRKAFLHLEGTHWWDTFIDAEDRESRIKRLKDSLPKVHKLPLMIFVEGKTPFAVCHGQRPSYDGLGMNIIPDHVLLENPDVVNSHEDEVTWGRQVFKRSKRSDSIHADGVRHTFVGHNIVMRKMVFDKHIFIDTGAYKNGKVHLTNATEFISHLRNDRTREGTHYTQDVPLKLHRE